MTKSIIGTVIRKSGAQTISVLVKRSVMHPMYGKKMTKTTKFLAHDPKDQAILGEKITITATKPISKSKHHIVVDSAKNKKETV